MATNKQILEGLWGLDVDQALLSGIDTGGTYGSLVKRLKGAGITDEQISRAQHLADWRPPEGQGIRQSLGSLLQTMGVPQETINRIIHSVVQNPDGSPKTYRDADLIRSAGVALGGQVGTNLAIKLGAPTAIPQGAPTWNPFRADAKEHGVAPGAAPAPSRAGGPQMRITGPTRPEPGLRPGVGAPPGGQLPAGELPDLGDQGVLPTDGGVTPVTPAVEKPLTPEERRARIEANYGWAAALGDDPEIAKILNDVANGTISETKADQLFKNSAFYKKYNSSAREWKIMERTDPVDAKRKRAENLGIILDLARTMGITEPDIGRMERLNDFVLSTGISDREVKRMLASEMRYDPEGAKTGISAQLKNIAREWLVPMSDQAMSTWVIGVAGGTKTTEDFTEYLRGMAKSMFPAIGAALDDPEMTTRTYMDPYAQDTANLLGINPADIDWMDPKYMRAFNQVDPKTNQRTVMTRSDWQRTLMKDPTYKYDETVHGKQQKQALTTGLMETFGFKLS